MNDFISSLGDQVISAGGKLLFAVIVWFAGKAAVKFLLNLIETGKLFDKVEGTVKTFILSFVNIGMYVILIISIIGILGVPMASIVTVLASAGVAIGLALQGALSNLAGGIMLLVFKPFKQGDFVETAGVSGSVREVTLFYTVLITPDHKRITIPNGSLMNANVVNYSSEETRRVDLTFSCGKNESPIRVQELIQSVLAGNKKLLTEPDAPFARLSKTTNEAMEFSVRVWCKNEDYWDVYYELLQDITVKLAMEGIKAPAVRVIAEKDEKERRKENNQAN